MRVLCIILLSFLSSTLAIVTLDVSPTVEVNTPVNVTWAREQGDPEKFDIHFLSNGVEPAGLAASVNSDQEIGTVSVVFPSQGDFTLEVVNDDHESIAESNPIEVGASSSSPSTGSTSTLISTREITSANSQTPISVSTPTSASTTASATPSLSITATDMISTPTSSISTSGSLSGPSRKDINRAVIAGGIFGGIAFLLLLSLILFLVRRRNHRKVQRRITFHRDMMIQHRPPPIDVERARESSPSIPAFPHSAPPPMVQPYTPVHEGPTERQMQLNKRVRQLEEMMHEIRFRPGMSRVLEQLRMQVAWLRSQKNSPWALGETDVPPAHYEAYML